jgi:putative ABC transport system permease protein
MTSRWKKVWADFWSNPGRTFLTILTIAVGVFAVGFNANMALYLNECMDGDYLSANPSEARVFAAPLDDNMIEIAQQMEGVSDAQGFSTLDLQLVHTEKELIATQFTSVEALDTLKVNQLKPIMGETFLPILREREVVIDYSAAALGYKVGDKITFELNDGRRRALTLGGYVHDVSGFPYNLTNQINAYITPETMEWMGGSRNYTMIAINVAENPADLDHVTQVAQSVADRMKDGGATVNFVFVFRPGHHFAWDIAQGMFFVLGILGWLTVILSGFLIVNTITALMTQQTRQIGIMKSIGGNALQIALMYATLIVSFGAVSLLISIPLSALAAQNIGAGMSLWLNIIPSAFHFYPATLIQQIIVGVGAPLIAASLPIYNSVRITVREAISDYGIGGNAQVKKKSVGKGALLIARPIRLSLRNAFRKKARLTLTLFTLILGGAIFIGVFNLWESFDQTIQDIQGYFLADVNIAFSRSYRFEELEEISMQVPGVEGVEGWGQYNGTVITSDDDAGKQIQFVAPPSTSTLIDPIITAGRWLVTGDENAIVIGNHLLAMMPELKVGDWLTIKINDKETKWHIVGIYSVTGNINPPLLYVNYEYISRLMHEPGQAYSVRVITSQHDLATQTRVNEQLQALFEAKGMQVTSTQLGEKFIQDQKAQTDIFVYFMLVMAVLIAVVGGLGLAGTMSINVLERTREIGVMRAIGASNADIQGIVIVEGMVVGLISWALSIPISLPITNALAYGVGMALMSAPMPAVYGIRGIVAWLIFTVVLGTIASALPARRASRLTVRDTLAYE